MLSPAALAGVWGVQGVAAGPPVPARSALTCPDAQGWEPPAARRCSREDKEERSLRRVFTGSLRHSRSQPGFCGVGGGFLSCFVFFFFFFSRCLSVSVPEEQDVPTHSARCSRYPGGRAHPTAPHRRWSRIPPGGCGSPSLALGAGSRDILPAGKEDGTGWRAQGPRGAPGVGGARPVGGSRARSEGRGGESGV